MSRRYFKRPWGESRGGHLDSWGAATYFFEIDALGYALRQLEQYANGPTLRYSQEYPDDASGILTTAIVVEDEAEWARYETTAEAFEEVWKRGPSGYVAARSVADGEIIRSMSACKHTSLGFDDHEFRCAHPGCGTSADSSIVRIEPGMAERDGWVIDGTCDLHHVQHLAMINEWPDLSRYPTTGPHIFSGDLREVLECSTPKTGASSTTSASPNQGSASTRSSNTYRTASSPHWRIACREAADRP